MIKEDLYHDTGMFQKTSSFAESRKIPGGLNYLHSGEDFVSEKFKQQEIYNLIDGVVSHTGTHRDYGNFIILRHNPKFANGGDELFFSMYCHLSAIAFSIVSKKFVEANTVIGFMGNSGNCLTKSLTGYRPVTEKEKNDVNCKKGVHLHLGFYQVAEHEERTRLLNRLIELGLIDIPQFPYELKFFWQWGKFFIHPEIIVKYFKILQGRNV